MPENATYCFIIEVKKGSKKYDNRKLHNVLVLSFEVFFFLTQMSYFIVTSSLRIHECVVEDRCSWLCLCTLTILKLCQNMKTEILLND